LAQDDSDDSDLSEYSEDDSEDGSDEDLSSEGMDSDEAEVRDRCSLLRSHREFGSHSVRTPLIWGFVYFGSGGPRRKTRGSPTSSATSSTRSVTSGTDLPIRTTTGPERRARPRLPRRARAPRSKGAPAASRAWAEAESTARAARRASVADDDYALLTARPFCAVMVDVAQGVMVCVAREIGHDPRARSAARSNTIVSKAMVTESQRHVTENAEQIRVAACLDLCRIKLQYTNFNPCNSAQEKVQAREHTGRVPSLSLAQG
jgi:hypothetical protein